MKGESMMISDKNAERSVARDVKSRLRSWYQNLFSSFVNGPAVCWLYLH